MLDPPWFCRDRFSQALRDKAYTIEYCSGVFFWISICEICIYHSGNSLGPPSSLDFCASDSRFGILCFISYTRLDTAMFFTLHYSSTVASREVKILTSGEV